MGVSGLKLENMGLAIFSGKVREGGEGEENNEDKQSKKMR